MRIVDRETFLAMPPGTVFSKFKPDIFGNIEIKGDSTTNAQGELIDFWSQDVAGAVEAASSGEFMHACDRAVAGECIPLDFDSQYRDGLYEAEQLFAVWDPNDVQALIQRLQLALIEAQP